MREEAKTALRQPDPGKVYSRVSHGDGRGMSFAVLEERNAALECELLLNCFKMPVPCRQGSTFSVAPPGSLCCRPGHSGPCPPVGAPGLWVGVGQNRHQGPEQNRRVTAGVWRSVIPLGLPGCDPSPHRCSSALHKESCFP